MFLECAAHRSDGVLDAPEPEWRTWPASADVKYQDNVSLATRYREPVIAWRQPTAEQKECADNTLAADAWSKQDLAFIDAGREGGRTKQVPNRTRSDRRLPRSFLSW